jgi:hypothetical protein
VFDGDLVLCPCGQNRVIAGPDANCWAESGNCPPVAASALSVDSDEFKSLLGYVYDEQVLARTPRVSPEGYPYLIKTADGQTFAGRLDSGGLLPRITTDAASTYIIHWGDEALAHKEWP